MKTSSGKYIQHPKIAEDFSAYLDLYYKYRDDYGVEEILAGQAKPAVFARLLQAPFDERLSLVSLILAGLEHPVFTASRQADAVADACYAFLRGDQKPLPPRRRICRTARQSCSTSSVSWITMPKTQQKRDAGPAEQRRLTTRLQVLAVLRRWEGELRRANAAGTQEAFSSCCAGSSRRWPMSAKRPSRPPAPRWKPLSTLWNRPLPKARDGGVRHRADGDPVSHAFLTENGCERYFQYKRICCWTTAKLPCSRSWRLSSAATGGVSHAGKCPVQHEQHHAVVFRHAAGLCAAPAPVF